MMHRDFELFFMRVIARIIARHIHPQSRIALTRPAFPTPLSLCRRRRLRHGSPVRRGRGSRGAARGVRVTIYFVFFSFFFCLSSNVLARSSRRRRSKLLKFSVSHGSRDSFDKSSRARPTISVSIAIGTITSPRTSSPYVGPVASDFSYPPCVCARSTLSAFVVRVDASSG